MRRTTARVCAIAVAVGLTGGASGETSNLFRDLDVSTLSVARAAVQQALEGRASGEPESWNVAGIARGSVVPLRTWRSKTGHWCREYREELELADGRRQSSLIVGCRTADGRWRITGG